MKEIRLNISMVSSLVGEYKGLFFLGAATFCAVCAVHFLSTVVFYRGDWGHIVSTGMINLVNLRK